jgi:hypothetical protein
VGLCVARRLTVDKVVVVDVAAASGECVAVVGRHQPGLHPGGLLLIDGHLQVQNDGPMLPFIALLLVSGEAGREAAAGLRAERPVDDGVQYIHRPL